MSANMTDEAAQLAAFERLAASEAATTTGSEPVTSTGGVLEPTTRVEVNIEAILDVPVTLSMEVGRTRIPIRNLLQLTQGSVVELERGAGEPLDVFVNGTLVAHGEVVVVNDKFGIRVTDVVSPAERIRKLK
jgi:flagellar motor switch protein FliN/FliY